VGTLQVSGSVRRRHALAGLAGGLFLALGAPPAAGAPPAFAPASPLAANAASDAAGDGPPAVAAGANGTRIAVWESNDTLGGTLGSDLDVLFARSTDGGATWSAPAPLDPLAASDIAADGEAVVATDGQGTWVVAWRSNRLSGGRIGDVDVLFARSLDDGLTWSPAELVHAQLASDGRTDDQPALATDGQGTWVVAWRSVQGESDLLFARSSDGGATWSAPAPLNQNAASDGGNDQRPALASDGQGTWLAAWSSTETLGGTLGIDEDVLLARSSDGGLTWSAPQPLNANAASDSGHDSLPALAADGAGGWLAVWQSGDSLGGTLGNDLDVLAARSSDAGQSWSAPAPVSTRAALDGARDAAPALACGARGRCTVAWHSNDDLGAGIGTDFDVLFATSEDGGATWSATAALDPRATLDVGVDQDVRLATDGRGGWAGVWRSTDSFGGTIGGDWDPLVAAGFEPAVCGDGVRYPQEACDDGNLLPGDGCRADCSVERCGDAILDPAEGCDDGNQASGDGCRFDCTIEACGDGVLDPDEGCDDGNGTAGDGCRADCSIEQCGDALLDPGEACDDGNLTSGDGCDAACQVEGAPPVPPGPGSLLEFFDAAVRDGTLSGTGSPSTARGRLRVLRLWLALAVDWADEGRRQRVAACSLLDLSLRRVDGRRRPADYVRGPAASELAERIAAFAEEAGCAAPRGRRGDAHGRCHGRGHGHGHDGHDHGGDDEPR
jgi:cysteine-rich repeat protein